LQKRLRLIIHLPADQQPAGNSPDLPEAIHNYFAYRLHDNQRRLRLFFRDGRIALLIGLVFLFACIVLREFAFAFGRGAVAEIAGEGLLIVGWVAMWRPLEIFLYDWRPIRRRCRVFAKLSEIPVIVRPA
jgi:archaellum biogenesis protein FlaJ (TadC family)